MFVVVAYDIVDNSKRNRLAKILCNFGRRVQKSVFECQLDDGRFLKMKESIEKEIDPQWDSVRIHALRRHLGLTQREMADTLGTRQQTISEWETGMYNPRGASATLLSMVAEQAKFDYQATPSPKTPKKH